MNSDEIAQQKQWEARNSDRKDTFEGVLYGVRTGEVRTIDHLTQERPTAWSPAAQVDSHGEILSDLPSSERQVHIWPPDVSPPVPGMMQQMMTREVQVNGEDGLPEPVLLIVDTYAPAADGD